MDPETEQKLLTVLDFIINDSKDLELEIRNKAVQFTIALTRINSTLSAIDRNIALLESKK